MNILPKSVSRVIESFERLPGVGPKTAQRLAFYILHMPYEEVDRFSDSLRNLKQSTMLCSLCKNVTEKDPCPICTNPNRDHRTVAVVEQPTDVLALEKTGIFHGVYHVLHGLIDPLNNIGPDEIYVDDLFRRITNENSVEELIFALNSTMESEATMLYIKKHIEEATKHASHRHITVSRLAHGLPMGADIEYADEITLKRAMEGRREY